jgi:hypothetical protein
MSPVRGVVEIAETCRYCRRRTARRSPRLNALEWVASAAYVYPFSCNACRRRFHAFRWGKRYTRVEGDRRAHERLDTSIPVTVIVNGHGTPGVITSLSPRGCGLTTGALLAIGELVRLDISGVGDRQLVIDVATVRSTHPPVIGIEFVHIQPGDARRLTGLLVRLRETVAGRRSSRRESSPRRRARALARFLATLGLTALCALAIAAGKPGL